MAEWMLPWRGGQGGRKEEDAVGEVPRTPTLNSDLESVGLQPHVGQEKKH